MLQKLIPILISFVLLSSCNSSKNHENSDLAKKDSAKIELTDRTIVGNDVDEHGCKPSAGYTWSVLKKECVRIFEVGSQFTAAGVNNDDTFAAYIILNQKYDSAEVFLPNKKPFIAVKGSNKILFENKLERIEISNDKATVNIFKGKNLIFSQSKSIGIGKLLGLK